MQHPSAHSHTRSQPNQTAQPALLQTRRAAQPCHQGEGWQRSAAAAAAALRGQGGHPARPARQRGPRRAANASARPQRARASPRAQQPDARMNWGSHEFREILFEIRECLRFSVDFCFPHPKFKFWGGKSTVRDRNGQGPEKKLRRRPPEWPFSQEIEHFHQTNEKHD